MFVNKSKKELNEKDVTIAILSIICYIKRRYRW